MARLVKEGQQDTEFKAWVESHFQSMPVLPIIRYLRSIFRYRPEYNEVLRTISFMLDEIDTGGFFEGDCDDASTFVAAVCAALRIPSRFVAIRYSHPSEFEHVFTEVFEAGRWIIADLTVPEGTRYHILERMVLNAA